MNQLQSIARVASAIVGLDLADLNAQVEAIEVGKLAAEKAMRRANARQAEIRSLLAERYAARREQNTRLVAEALLEGAAIDDALATTTNDDELEAERAALQAASNNLWQRSQSAFGETLAVKREAIARIGPLVEPLCDELVAAAQGAVERLTECYAALSAISSATSFSVPEVDGLNAALSALGGRLAAPSSMPVPGEVTSVLCELEDRGPALPFTPISVASLSPVHPRIVYVPMPKR